MTAKIGILNISDRASAGIYEDTPGQFIVQTLREFLRSDWTPVYHVVPDEEELIAQHLIRLSDEEGCSLIVTCGGTGPALSDVTPEATEKVCHKLLPGFGELMRSESLRQVPTAILSRQTAGIRNHCLIINLPGKPSAIRLCLEAVFPAVPYCIDLIGGAYLETNEEVIKAFRPAR